MLGTLHCLVSDLLESRFLPLQKKYPLHQDSLEKNILGFFLALGFGFVAEVEQVKSLV